MMMSLFCLDHLISCLLTTTHLHSPRNWNVPHLVAFRSDVCSHQNTQLLQIFFLVRLAKRKRDRSNAEAAESPQLKRQADTIMPREGSERAVMLSVIIVFFKAI